MLAPLVSWGQCMRNGGLQSVTNPAGEWQQVFFDGFDSEEHTLANWYLNRVGDENTDRLHCFDTTPDLLGGKNKALSLIAEKNVQFLRITATPDSSAACTPQSRYRSGGLRLKPNPLVDGAAHGVYAMQRGLFEVRCRLPRYRARTTKYGANAGFWLLSNDMECDIVEGNDGLSGFATTLHNWNAAATDCTRTPAQGEPHPFWQAIYAYTSPYVGAPGLDEGFHTYGLAWSEDELTWYFDGQVLSTIRYRPGQCLPGLVENGMFTPFGRAAQVLLGLEVVDASFQEAQFDVDFVRICKPANDWAAPPRQLE
ncbi:glycoside hydrolase family 16 protein [Hymenobacter radiodurans]|uniref:glycoside hydrolase family 16 protein n=1 Tax=Hymenobacter radiodurans TaxID=2496028 RepID=UPI001404B44B|nr:family 16 glycosylhydrolase [Hymenobacter radiodurans]